jgi:hypothetical protein
MLQGFWHKRRVANPALVEATFWPGNLAVGCRVLLFLLPTVVRNTVPGSLLVARMAFALSGVPGWGAGGVPGNKRADDRCERLSSIYAGKPLATGSSWTEAREVSRCSAITL